MDGHFPFDTKCPYCLALCRNKSHTPVKWEIKLLNSWATRSQGHSKKIPRPNPLFKFNDIIDEGTSHIWLIKQQTCGWSEQKTEWALRFSCIPVVKWGTTDRLRTVYVQAGASSRLQAKYVLRREIGILLIGDYAKSMKTYCARCHRAACQNTMPWVSGVKYDIPSAFTGPSTHPIHV
jgi:hypothetical protein